MAEEEDYCPDDCEEGFETHLGFLVVPDGRRPLFDGPDWEDWDGGKVGGKPVWLHDCRLPTVETLACKTCKEPLTFLLEIYCPLEAPLSAFHRFLYMFCCRKAACIRQGGILCLRTQCSREEWLARGARAEMQHSNLCEVCGCSGPLSCARCRSANYCSRQHQKAHWPAHRRSCGKEGALTKVDDAPNTLLFPEYEIFVELEQVGDELAQGDEASRDLEDALSPDDADNDESEDALLTQSDYDHSIGATSTDPTYVKFLARVRRGGPKQVLRYVHPDQNRDGTLSHPKPLEVRNGSALSIDRVPPCPYCGAPRQFEFQIMPQLLYYLKVDEDTVLSPSPADPTGSTAAFRNVTNEDIDWGSLDVFTCSRSCETRCAKEERDSWYKEEFVWRQPEVLG